MTRSIIDISDNDCTKVSPCKKCHWHIQGIEKNRCIAICQRLSAYREGLEYDHLPCPELKDLQDVEETEDKIPPKNTKHKAKLSNTLQKTEKTNDSMPDVEKVSVKRNKDDITKSQPTCLIPGCDKPAKLRGLCQTDYDRWRNGTIDHPEAGQYKRSNVRAEKGICLIEGCNESAEVRGLCHSHYQAFRKGTIEHPTQGKFVVSQVHHKSKIKVDPPKPQKEKKPVLRSYPFPDIVLLNFTDYPELKAIVFETASKFLMPINHIIMTLIGEAVATRVKKYKANK